MGCKMECERKTSTLHGCIARKGQSSSRYALGQVRCSTCNQWFDRNKLDEIGIGKFCPCCGFQFRDRAQKGAVYDWQGMRAKRLEMLPAYQIVVQQNE